MYDTPSNEKLREATNTCRYSNGVREAEQQHQRKTGAQAGKEGPQRATIAATRRQEQRLRRPAPSAVTAVTEPLGGGGGGGGPLPPAARVDATAASGAPPAGDPRTLGGRGSRGEGGDGGRTRDAVQPGAVARRLQRAEPEPGCRGGRGAGHGRPQGFGATAGGRDDGGGR